MRAIGLKLLRTALILGAIVMIVRLAGPKMGERMERMFEDAPEDFPPKWMFVNITAIRDNTERILERLPAEPVETEPEAA